MENKLILELHSKDVMAFLDNQGNKVVKEVEEKQEMKRVCPICGSDQLQTTVYEPVGFCDINGNLMPVRHIDMTCNNCGLTNPHYNG